MNVINSIFSKQMRVVKFNLFNNLSNSIFSKQMKVVKFNLFNNLSSSIFNKQMKVVKFNLFNNLSNSIFKTQLKVIKINMKMNHIQMIKLKIRTRKSFMINMIVLCSNIIKKKGIGVIQSSKKKWKYFIHY